MTIKRFFTAFIICALIITAVVAMVRADLYSRELSGDYTRSIFSYEKINYNRGRLEILGKVYTVDLEYIDVIKGKLNHIYNNNLNFIPDFILNTADIFSEMIIDVINSLQIKLNMV